MIVNTNKMGKIIRWGILGTGFIARKFAEGLAVVENAELYAVASRNKVTAIDFATTYNVQRYFTSYEELAQCAEVDVVYIATPHNLHYSNTILCLSNNKHVLCEKPFAVNGHEVRKMISLAKEKQLFLMEAFWARFLPHIIKIKELIDNGTIGEITLLKADLCLFREFDPNNRLFNKTLVGGSLLDVGIYPIFLALYLLGKPTSFSASAAFGPTEVDHSCSVTFNYSNTTLAILYSSVVAETEVKAEIHGTKGKIELESFWFCPSNFHLSLHQNAKEYIEIPHVGNGYNYEAQEVTNCILENRTESNVFNFNDSLQLIDMLDEIRQTIGLVYPNHDI